MKKPGLAAVSFLALCLSVPTGANGQNANSLRSDYAAALQVREAEVDGILAKQAEALELSRVLEQTIPDDFAGMRISPSRNFSVTVYLKSGNPDVLRRFTSNPDYRVRPARFSLSELNAILGEVRAAMNAARINYGAFIDLDNQIVQVSVPNAQETRRLLRPLEDSQRVRIVEEDITAVPTVMAGESATVGSYGCTTGFSVKHSDGRVGVLTAGHCPNSSMTVGSTSSIAYAGSLLNSTNQRDLQWHEKSTGTFTGQTKVTGGTALNVNGWANSAVGAVICMNGATSGNKCGKIISLGYSGNSYELTAPTVPIPVADGVIIEATTPGTQMCAEGDSGGPVYSTANTSAGNSLALGTEFAGLSSYRIGTTTPKKFSRCVYVKAVDLQTLGLRLIVQ